MYARACFLRLYLRIFSSFFFYCFSFYIVIVKRVLDSTLPLLLSASYLRLMYTSTILLPRARAQYPHACTRAYVYSRVPKPRDALPPSFNRSRRYVSSSHVCVRACVCTCIVLRTSSLSLLHDYSIILVHLFSPL